MSHSENISQVITATALSVVLAASSGAQSTEYLDQTSAEGYMVSGTNEIHYATESFGLDWEYQVDFESWYFDDVFIYRQVSGEDELLIKWDRGQSDIEYYTRGNDALALGGFQEHQPNSMLLSMSPYLPFKLVSERINAGELSVFFLDRENPASFDVSTQPVQEYLNSLVTLSSYRVADGVIVEKEESYISEATRAEFFDHFDESPRITPKSTTIYSDYNESEPRVPKRIISSNSNSESAVTFEVDTRVSTIRKIEAGETPGQVMEEYAPGMERREIGQTRTWSRIVAAMEQDNHRVIQAELEGLGVASIGAHSSQWLMKVIMINSGIALIIIGLFLRKK